MNITYISLPVAGTVVCFTIPPLVNFPRSLIQNLGGPAPKVNLLYKQSYTKGRLQ